MSGIKSVGFYKKKFYITFFYDEHYIEGYLIPYHEGTFAYDLSDMKSEDIEKMKKELFK